jgi:hypothetical protein
MRLLARREYDEAWRAAAEIPRLEQRSEVLVTVALAAADAKDLGRASELLNKAADVVAKSGTTATPEKARSLVRLAEAYARVDPVRGFEVMQSAIAALNTAVRVDAPEATPLDAEAGVRSPRARNGQRAASAQVESGLQGLAALARFDYFRALGLAQSVDDKALSILAQLAVARGALRSSTAGPTVKRDKRPAAPDRPKAEKPAGPAAPRAETGPPAGAAPRE